MRLGADDMGRSARFKIVPSYFRSRRGLSSALLLGTQVSECWLRDGVMVRRGNNVMSTMCVVRESGGQIGTG